MESTMVLRFESGVFDPSLLDKIVRAGFCVVFVMAHSPDILRVALAAERRGILVQGFAWLGLDTVAGADASKVDGLESAEAAKAVMHTWVYFEPDIAPPVSFFDRARAATRANFPCLLCDDAHSDALSTPFAANMYDAVMLYATAMAMGSIASPGLNGRDLVQAMLNSSFDGMTGRLQLDENGDMRESIRAMNYVVDSDGSMYGRQIGLYDALERRYSPLQNSTVVWPGSVYVIPADLPEIAIDVPSIWTRLGPGLAALLVTLAIVCYVGRLAWQRTERARRCALCS